MSETEMLARDLSVAILGDEVEWRGFMSKAEEIVGRRQSRGCAPQAPDGWILVPRELTAENGAKAALIGEFSEKITVLDENGDDQRVSVPVSWDSIKLIHKAMVKLFEAGPPVRSAASSAAPAGYPPGLPKGWTPDMAARASWTVFTLANTPPDEWERKAVIYEALAAFRTPAAARNQGEGGGPRS